MELMGCTNCKFRNEVMLSPTEMFHECVAQGVHLGLGKFISNETFYKSKLNEYTNECWCKYWEEEIR